MHRRLNASVLLLLALSQLVVTVGAMSSPVAIGQSRSAASRPDPREEPPTHATQPSDDDRALTLFSGDPLYEEVLKRYRADEGPRMRGPRFEELAATVARR